MMRYIVQIALLLLTAAMFAFSFYAASFQLGTYGFYFLIDLLMCLGNIVFYANFFKDEQNKG